MRCLWLFDILWNMSSYLTRVKINVSMFAAVAAFCWSHQWSWVWAATVKLYRAGGVIGGTGCYMTMLSCHLNCVETHFTGFGPGEISFVCPTVHMSGEVDWLTGSWRRTQHYNKRLLQQLKHMKLSVLKDATCAHFDGWGIAAEAVSILCCNAEGIPLSTQ